MLNPCEELILCVIVMMSWECSSKALLDPGSAMDCLVTHLFLEMSLNILLKHMLILKMCLSPVGFEGKLCLTALMAWVLLLSLCDALVAGHLNLPRTALCFWDENPHNHFCLHCQTIIMWKLCILWPLRGVEIFLMKQWTPNTIFPSAF